MIVPTLLLFLKTPSDKVPLISSEEEDIFYDCSDTTPLPEAPSDKVPLISNEIKQLCYSIINSQQNFLRNLQNTSSNSSQILQNMDQQIKQLENSLTLNKRGSKVLDISEKISKIIGESFWKYPALAGLSWFLGNYITGGTALALATLATGVWMWENHESEAQVAELEITAS